MSRDVPHAGDAPRDPHGTCPDASRDVDHDVDVLAQEHDRGAIDRVAESLQAESKPSVPTDAGEAESRLKRGAGGVIDRVASHVAARGEVDGPKPDDETRDPKTADAALSERIGHELSELAPELASVTRKLVEDQRHPLDLTRALHDPARQVRSLELLAELGEGRLLKGEQSVTDYIREHPGRGPLFEPVAREVNHAPEGRSRMAEYVEALKVDDPVRATGPNPDGEQRAMLDQYARRLDDDVLPAVIAEVDALVESIPDAQTSVRVKTADGILDKVERMTSGSDSRPPRPGYEVGDVIDAVGARITVEDTRSLATLLQRCQDHIGTGDDGRVLEIENMYAAPKSGNPAYRVVLMTVAIRVDDRQYTYELQLTTRRASVAADLEHNTVYKPYLETTADERREVMQAFHEAAALDQEETRRNSP